MACPTSSLERGRQRRLRLLHAQRLLEVGAQVARARARTAKLAFRLFGPASPSSPSSACLTERQGVRALRSLGFGCADALHLVNVQGAMVVGPADFAELALTGEYVRKTRKSLQERHGFTKKELSIFAASSVSTTRTRAAILPTTSFATSWLTCSRIWPHPLKPAQRSSSCCVPPTKMVTDA